jgi:surfeit locus 1 family protein
VSRTALGSFEYTVLSVVGNRRFKPTLFAAVLALLGIAGCLRLGLWQLERADQKRALLSAFAGGSERAVVAGSDLGKLPRYQSIELTGRYDTRQQVLLDNMPSARGQPGYHVLTPLQRESGDWVLVDRGWVAAGATRAQLPNVEVDGRVRIVRGQLDELPRPGIRLGGAGSSTTTTATSWPRVLNFPRHEELTALLGRPLAQRLVLLDASQRDGYERLWQARFGFGPERHLAYAVQWFALLAAIAITFVVMSLKKVADPDVG